MSSPGLAGNRESPSISSPSMAASSLSLDSISSRVSRRRAQGRSSLDSHGDTSIPIDIWLAEQEIHYAAVPYSPELPLHGLAHRTPSALADAFSKDQTQTIIHGIVKDADLGFGSVTVINRSVRRLGVVPCLSIIVTGDPTKLYDAAQKVHEYVAGLGVVKFITEVYNPDRMTEDQLFALPNKHPQIDMLSRLRDEAFNVARHHLGKDLIGTTVYMMLPTQMRKSNEQHLVETLAVWVKEDSIKDFDALIQRLNTLVETQADGLEVQVRLLETASVQPSRAFDTFGAPARGASIAVDGNPDAGSLGGFLLFKDRSGARKQTLMTASHVIFPHDNTLASRIKESGLPLDHGPPKIHVRYPAPIDVNDSISQVQEALDQHEKDLKKAQAEVDKGLETRLNLDLIDTKPKEIAQCKERMAALKNLKSKAPIGHVLTASPLTKGTEARLDWALVEVTASGIFTPNAPPDREKLRPQAFKKHLYSPGGVIDRIGDLEPSQWVIMQGRISDVVTGITNGMRMLVQWSETGQASDNTLISTKEWQVLTADEKDGGDPGHHTFGGPGDSGAWVCDRHGSLVGLYWGGSRLAHKHVGLVTPMKEITADITSRTMGGTVSLPTPHDK